MIPLPLAPTPARGSGLDLPDWLVILVFAVATSAATVASYRKWKAGKGLIHLYSLWIPAAVFIAVVIAVVVN